MTPEQRSRQEIDRQLEQCGWVVQNFRDMNISAGLGVAVREFPLKSGSADYLLYADCKALGVVEAKPEGHITGVETQSGKYLDGLPNGLPNFCLPLPFAYESTGTVTHFTNALEPDARSREVFTFHRPEELIRLATLDHQMRGLLRHMPPLNTQRLWRVQVDSIQNLEASLADNCPRSLIQMATGSGKTYTAVSFSYRLIKFGRVRRILFLVDRNNLGKQTCNGVNNLFTGLAVAEDGTAYSLRPCNYHLYLVRRSVMAGLAKDVPAVPYAAFERAMLKWLREVQINVDDGGVDVQPLQARKDDLERRIAELMGEMRSGKNLKRLRPC